MTSLKPIIMKSGRKTFIKYLSYVFENNVTCILRIVKPAISS